MVPQSMRRHAKRVLSSGKVCSSSSGNVLVCLSNFSNPDAASYLVLKLGGGANCGLEKVAQIIFMQ